MGQKLLWAGQSCRDWRLHGWSEGCRGLWCLLTLFLLFIVPYLHMNAWVSVWLELLTLSANHRAKEDNERCHADALQAWGTIVGSPGNRQKAGGGEDRTRLSKSGKLLQSKTLCQSMTFADHRLIRASHIQCLLKLFPNLKESCLLKIPFKTAF